MTAQDFHLEITCSLSMHTAILVPKERKALSESLSFNANPPPGTRSSYPQSWGNMKRLGSPTQRSSGFLQCSVPTGRTTKSCAISYSRHRSSWLSICFPLLASCRHFSSVNPLHQCFACPLSNLTSISQWGVLYSPPER